MFLSKGKHGNFIGFANVFRTRHYVHRKGNHVKNTNEMLVKKGIRKRIKHLTQSVTLQQHKCLNSSWRRFSSFRQNIYRFSHDSSPLLFWEYAFLRYCATAIISDLSAQNFEISWYMTGKKKKYSWALNAQGIYEKLFRSFFPAKDFFI